MFATVPNFRIDRVGLWRRTLGNVIPNAALGANSLAWASYGLVLLFSTNYESGKCQGTHICLIYSVVVIIRAVFPASC